MLLSSFAWVRCMRSPEGTPIGTLKRILISDINVWNADSRYSSIISGVPGASIEDVTFRNIHIYYKGGYSEEDGKRTPPEQEKVYPEPWMFGTIPAKGFYIRHAKNITFDGVRFHFGTAGRTSALCDRRRRKH